MEKPKDADPQVTVSQKDTAERLRKEIERVTGKDSPVESPRPPSPRDFTNRKVREKK